MSCDFHVRALREWQIAESESQFFSAQVVLAESFGRLEVQSKPFFHWACGVVSDALTAVTALALTSTPSSVTAVAKFAAIKAPSLTKPCTMSSSSPTLFSQRFSSPPASPESPPGAPPQRDSDYGGVPVVWPVPQGPVLQAADSFPGRGGLGGKKELFDDSWLSSAVPPIVISPVACTARALIVTSPTKRAAFSPPRANENRPPTSQGTRFALSQVKNSFCPRQATGADKSLSDIVAPSWRDL